MPAAGEQAHADRAEALFRQGFNCAQSMVAAFADELGLDRETALRLASSFGGGMGRLRETCGALTGLFMIAGLACGYADPGDAAAKAAHYRLIQSLAERFREAHGSLLCRDLLADVETAPGPEPEARSDAYYQRRPCMAYIRFAASMADELVQPR